MIKFQLHKVTIICTAVLGILTLTSAGTFAQQVQILDLRSEGWTEIEKWEEIKKFPGERPYENLTRVIQFVHFVFKKDGIKKYCWMSYDSQRDQVNEECKPN